MEKSTCTVLRGGSDGNIASLPGSTVISLKKLIIAKRAADRPKDKLILPELEALQEASQEDPE